MRKKINISIAVVLMVLIAAAAAIFTKQQPSEERQNEKIKIIKDAGLEPREAEYYRVIDE